MNKHDPDLDLKELLDGVKSDDFNLEPEDLVWLNSCVWAEVIPDELDGESHLYAKSML